MIKYLWVAALALAASGCGSVIHSTAIDGSRSGTALQVYALPESVLRAEFGTTKDGPWTVALSAQNRPSRSSADWYRLYHSDHSLFGDNFTLTVANGLLTTANSTSTPDAVSAITNLGNLVQTIEGLTERPDTEPENVVMYFAPPGAEPEIAYTFGYQLWPAQSQCEVASLYTEEAQPRPACQVQVGFATIIYEQDCANPVANLPGNLLSEGTCANGQRRETRAIGAVGMYIETTGSYRDLRHRISSGYSSGPDSNGVRFRVTAPLEAQADFSCSLFSGPWTNSFPSIERQADLFCSRLSELQRFAAISNPVQTIDVVVPGGFFTSDITRNLFGTRTVNLTFDEGVLTSVHIEQSATAAAAILLPLTALGFFVANDD